ncbi:MAG: CapA family protein [Eubacteriales bacterium]|nr:CapA family protein [Eubacteriales bacterium]
MWNTYTKNKKQKEMEAAAAAAQQQQQEEADALALEEQNTLTLLAAGDNMFYDRILTSGSKNNWNFDFLYSRIAEDIQAADFAITSQGSVFTSDHNSVSGYPLFAAPTEAADAQAAAGFDAILHASSLTFAFGESGVLNTLEFWKQNHPEIYPLGIHASQTDADTVAVAEVKNFKISMLNMCQEFSSSGFTSENSYLIDVLSRARVTALVSKAKKEGNLVVFFLNAGTAGTEEPDEAMQEWVEFLVDEGVDIIIGSGSHVVQSYEMLENDDGHKTLVYYSLGNLVSTQESVSGLLGGMAQITVKRSEVTHEVYVEDYTMLPTVMHYNEKKDNFQVYPLDEYTSELAEEHDIHQYSDEEFTLSSIRTRFRELSAKITEQAPESSADSMQEENAEPEAKSDSAAE